MCDLRETPHPKPRASVRRLRRRAGLLISQLGSALRSGSSSGATGLLGLVPAVFVVALALALMLWALPRQDSDAQSTWQAPSLPLHLTSMTEH